jgi:ABC-type transport system substrate-binding protein
MRIRTVTGLAFAAAAAAASVGLGTAAYADGQGETLVITTEDSTHGVTPQTAADGATAPWDCPESDGAGSSESSADSL